MKQLELISYKVKEVVPKIKSIQDGVKYIEAPSLWKQGIKGDDVVVAVLDSGCQMDHPLLQSQIIGGYNFTTDYKGNPANFSDNTGHGTHVCGIIAASNNSTVVGVAPKVSLLVLKVVTKNGRGDNKWSIQAIEYAIRWRGPNQQRVRVISMSLGGPDNDPKLHQAVKKAVTNNIVFVCAAGNKVTSISRNQSLYPGSYKEVIKVGSINLQGEISSFTNTSPEIDIFAPGENILSTYLNSGYAVMSGTSMATPYVSGAIALLIQYKEGLLRRRLTVSEIYKILMKRTIEGRSNRFKQHEHRILKLARYRL
ncbi:S8 family peptidase [Bacillus sp. CGMCC 1.16607]|uniref:S8 family peptidase n=1 Tax=Bacillus sp. CGMCC 1.16607 TaxID=3351842 RepID=UPI00363BB363